MKKKILIPIIIVIIAWLTIGLIDFNSVRLFERPTFCILINGEDDGGSGQYVGLGYSFDIEGNFMPDDEFPGVTRYTAKIFGVEVSSEIRD